MSPSPLNKKLELLSPARDINCAQSAILAGADAVYIGGPDFGARAAARNSLENLKTLCTFAHFFGAKVHVTLNTLLYDNELKTAQEDIYGISECGADVLIIQDPALFTLDIPDNLKLHASTQCNIDTVEKLLYYKERGVSQVVLPREFTLSKIKEFSLAAPDIRLEAFILGALCVGVSGICHISDYLKGRSANRGECAQICRLPMQLYRDNEEIAVGHLLSLKDNNLVPHLSKLIQAGVSSFKIEGRLKDEDYVINTTAYAHEALTAFIREHEEYERESYANNRTSDFRIDIGKTFNRGFTDGLLLDDNTSLNNDVTPKFLGEEFGTLQDFEKFFNDTQVTVKTATSDIVAHNGDGITYLLAPKKNHKNNPHTQERVQRVLGFRISKVLYKNGDNVTFLVQGTPHLVRGSTLYRNYDADYLWNLRESVLNTRVLPYSLVFDILDRDGDITLNLKASSSYKKSVMGSLSYTYDATAPIIDFVKLFKTLKKKFNIYSHCKSLSVGGDPSKLTLKVSALNALRREVLEKFFAYDRELPSTLEKAKTPPCAIPFFFVDSRLVLNEKAQSVYGRTGIRIVDTGVKKGSSPDFLKQSAVLKSRFCLIGKYARCSKEGGRVKGFSLKVSGKTFKILCDCKKCFMYLLKDDG